MEKYYATLKDVAKRAGTTAATVSYVLNESKGRYISPEMRQRVIDAAKELNYVKSSVGSSLKGKKRKMIAVLVPQFENQFFTRIILAIENIADQYGYILSICNTFDDVKREEEILYRMQQQRVDGYIIIPTKEGAKNTQQLRQLGIPMVIVDRPLEGVENYFWVTTKNYQCGYVGTQYLIQNGHEHIAYIGWDSGIKDLLLREKGFYDALEEEYIAKEEALVLRGAFTQEAGYRMTQDIIENHKDITAIFYGYNIQAKGGVQYLTENNIEPGTDVSIVIIGSPEWATIGKNNFTHVNQHDYSLGNKAAELLFEIINKEEKTQAKHIMQGCTLIEGSSVHNIKKKEEGL